jgi:hypothetical protein
LKSEKKYLYSFLLFILLCLVLVIALPGTTNGGWILNLQHTATFDDISVVCADRNISISIFPNETAKLTLVSVRMKDRFSTLEVGDHINMSLWSVNSNGTPLSLLQQYGGIDASVIAEQPSFSSHNFSNLTPGGAYEIQAFTRYALVWQANFVNNDPSCNPNYRADFESQQVPSYPIWFSNTTKQVGGGAWDVYNGAVPNLLMTFTIFGENVSVYVETDTANISTNIIPSNNQILSNNTVNFHFGINITNSFTWNLYINNTLNKTATGIPGGQNVEIDINSTFFNETTQYLGHYNYSFEVFDDTTGENTSITKFNINSTRLTLNVSIPSPNDDDSFSSNNITFNISVNASGVFNVDLYVNNSINRSLTNLGGGQNVYVAFQVNFSPSIESNFNFSFHVWDDLNSVNTSINRFYIDTVSPSITWNYPLTDNSSINNQTSIAINVVCSDNNLFAAEINITSPNNGVSVFNSTISGITSSTYTFNNQTSASGWLDGIYDVDVYCLDDHTDGEQPKKGKKGEDVLLFNSTDDSQTSTVSILFIEKLNKSTDLPGNTITTFTSGDEWDINFTVLKPETKIIFNITSTEKIVHRSGVSGIDGHFVWGKFYHDFSVSKNFKVNGGDRTAKLNVVKMNDYNYLVYWIPDILLAGGDKVYIDPLTGGLNLLTESKTLTIDRTPPNVTGILPTNGTTVQQSSSVQLSVNASDVNILGTTNVNVTAPNGSIFTLSLSNATLGTSYKGKFNVSFPHTSTTGTYTALYLINDSVDNQNYTQSSTFVVVLSGTPLVNLIEPQDGITTQNAYQNLQYTVSPSGSIFSSVSIYTKHDTDSWVLTKFDTTSPNGTFEFTYSVEGTYQWYISYNDTSNVVTNSSTRSFIYDLVSQTTGTPGGTTSAATQDTAVENGTVVISGDYTYSTPLTFSLIKGEDITETVTVKSNLEDKTSTLFLCYGSDCRFISYEKNQTFETGEEKQIPFTFSFPDDYALDETAVYFTFGENERFDLKLIFGGTFLDSVKDHLTSQLSISSPVEGGRDLNIPYWLMYSAGFSTTLGFTSTYLFRKRKINKFKKMIQKQLLQQNQK